MSASASPGEPHQTSPEYRDKLQQQAFDLLCQIQRKLKRRRKHACFDNDQLTDILVTRGATLDIDETDPIDLEPRFFLPGAVDAMEAGVRLENQAGWPGEPLMDMWPRCPPIEAHRARNPSRGDLDYQAYQAVQDAAAKGGFCEGPARRTGDWRRTTWLPTRSMPWDNRIREGLDGRLQAVYFRSGKFMIWPRQPGEYAHHPDVPHSLATVYDASRPSKGGLLRSELEVAVTLIKMQMGDPAMYGDHRIHPALVMSFHHAFSARVIQAHVDHGRLLVRSSRLLNLHTVSISADAKLAIRWLNPRPVGDTRFPSSAMEPLDQELGAQELDVGPPSAGHVAVRH